MIQDLFFLLIIYNPRSESVSQRPHLGKAKHTDCICIVVCHTIYTILINKPNNCLSPQITEHSKCMAYDLVLKLIRNNEGVSYTA